jgi:hypothetical protein
MSMSDLEIEMTPTPNLSLSTSGPLVPTPSPKNSPSLSLKSENRKASLQNVVLAGPEVRIAFVCFFFFPFFFFKEVNAALEERRMSSTLEPASTAGSLERTNTGSLKVERKGHQRNRSGGSKFLKRFKSAFPSKAVDLSVFDASGMKEVLFSFFFFVFVFFIIIGPISPSHSVDGGFQNHQKSFSGRPMFGSCGDCHVVETYLGDGNWTFSLDSVTIPPSFRIHFTEKQFEETRPKTWLYAKGCAVIVGLFQNDEAVTILIASGHGIRRLSIDVPNLTVMSPDELRQHVLFSVDPTINPLECSRVSKDNLEKVWNHLRSFEERIVDRVVEIDVVEYPMLAEKQQPTGALSAGEKHSKRRLSRGSRRVALFPERMFQALTKREDFECVDDTIVYKWQHIEFRLHFVSSINLATREVVLCILPDDAALVVPPNNGYNKGRSQVIIALRERDQKVEVACCRYKEILPFGPPFFPTPFKEKHVQTVVSAKILHGLAALHTLEEEEKVVEMRKNILSPIFHLDSEDVFSD